MKNLIFLFSLLILTPVTGRADTSKLWGSSGENWHPSGRLPDFSFAGYYSGQKSIPNWPVKRNVKDFGAVGDGVTDDTAAFLKALEVMEDGVLSIPTGRYRLTQVLEITKSHFVIRGEGPEKTVLFFPKSLTDVAGPGKGHAPSDSWSWSGGFISVQGDNDDDLLASVTQPAYRGQNRVTVASVSRLSPGQRVRLWEYDADGTLGRALYNDQAPSPEEFLKRKIIDFSSKIQSIEGTTLILERPLRVDVRLAWKPAIYSDEPAVTDVGIENLTMEFPVTKYAGHHEEPGFNAFDFSQVENSWIRNVTIVNADSGIFLREGTKFCTIQGVHLVATKGRARVGYGSDSGEPQTVDVEGHHGILITGLSQDNLVTDFRVDARFIHELGVENAAAGNVFSSCSGRDMALDHHRRAPYENLFTNIDAGEGTHLWEIGGDETDGPPSGVRETFWNIRTRLLQTPPSWALEANLIGITTKSLSDLSPADNWFEAIPPDRLTPPDLYLDQVAAKRKP